MALPATRELSASEAGAAIAPALGDLRDGRPVVVCDDRGGSARLVMAAQFATPDAVQALLARDGAELCLDLGPRRFGEIALAADLDGAPPVASAECVARAVQEVINSRPGALRRLPATGVAARRARNGGVVARAGHAEVAVELAAVAGLLPATLSTPAVAGHEHRRVSITEVAVDRLRRAELVERIVATPLPTRHGRFTAVGYRSFDERDVVALVKGDVTGRSDVLVRLHAGCPVGDVFHSLNCSCREQLEAALAAMEGEGCGALLYLPRTRSGLRLIVGATAAPEPAVARAAQLAAYGIGAQMLADIGVTSVRLLSDAPQDVESFTAFGVAVRPASR
jgi:3,4-dihydroxy 2-butanone 4-phosphate synthase/GTP cyclohydrolase II